MILIIDNYDSFTYNLVQYVGQITSRLKVFRNDTISLEEVRKLGPEKIIISPGPGRPEEAGISIDIVKTLGPHTPILGVCLGHQAIGAAFGGKVVPAPQIVHGKTSEIRHNSSAILDDIPKTFRATRYHSLVVNKKTLPDVLKVTAETVESPGKEGLIMALEHREYPIYGVQFHPESIATKHGMTLIKNFLFLQQVITP